MKIKYNMLSAAILIMLGGMALTSCNSEGDGFDFNKNGLLITGTEKGNVQKFTVEDTPSNYGITVQSTKKVEEDVNLTLAIDNSLVEKYNAENGANYYPIPEGSVELENSNVVIAAGKAVSTASMVKVVSTENFEEGRSYMIPVTIKSVSNGMDVINASRTIYLRISRVLSFHHLSYDAAGSSEYHFAENLQKTLTNYTIQFKFYSNGFGGVGNIKRPLSVGGSKDGDNGDNMWRFGENGSAGGDILQWVNPSGKQFFSNTHFAANRWYLVTCTYDGSEFKMYIDNNSTPDNTVSASGKNTYLNRVEIGMSWGGYNNSQYFSGRLAEIRVWNKALSVSEIATGLCGVDPKSDGLVAYWKMDQSEGTIILDKTGNGYDMDWNDTWRADYEGDNIHNTDYGKYLHWVIDDNNKCAQ
jgi:hypothetical protein